MNDARRPPDHLSRLLTIGSLHNWDSNGYFEFGAASNNFVGNLSSIHSTDRMEKGLSCSLDRRTTDRGDVVTIADFNEILN